MTESIVSIVDRYCLAIFRARAFSDDDDRVARSFRTSGNQSWRTNSIVENLKHSLVTERMFRNQYNMRLSCDSAHAIPSATSSACLPITSMIWTQPCDPAGVRECSMISVMLRIAVSKPSV